MSGGSWRDSARPKIAEVIEANPDASEAKLRRILLDRYPWGQRKHHPYKIWLDEINVQLGAKDARRRQKAEQERLEQDAKSGQQSFI